MLKVLTLLLQPLQRWQKRMAVFSQIEYPRVQGGHYGGGEKPGDTRN